MRFIALTIVGATVLVAAVTPAYSQAVDSVIPLGGTLDAAVPEDGAAVIGVLIPKHATKLTVKIKIDKKSGLDPEFEIRNPDGSLLDPIPAGGSIKIKPAAITGKKLPADQTGLYLFILRGKNGNAADFRIQVKGKVAKGPKLSGFLNDIAEVDDIPIAVPDNSFLTVKLGPAKNSGLAPALEVLTASGRVLDLDGFTKEKNGKITLKNLPLPFFGTYLLRIRSAGGSGGYSISAKVKAVKIKPDATRPVASVGDDIITTPETAVGLTGSGPAGANLRWEQVSGQTVALSGADTATPSFTAPAEGATLAFQLVATSGGVDSFAETMIVQVDQPPIAIAGPSQSVDTGAAVTLDGSESFDLDSSAPLTYEWTQVSGTNVTLAGEDSAAPTFTAPGASAVLVFELVVNDGLVDSLGDRVIVGVDSADGIADAGRPVIISPDDSVYLSGLRTLGMPGKFAWTRVDNGPGTISLSRADTPSAAFSAPRTPGQYRFRLTVDDVTATADSILVIVTRFATNTEPDADAGGIASIAAPGAFELDGSTSADGDGDTLRHEWLQIGGAEAVLTGSGATRDGTAAADDDVLRFLLMVHDGLKYGPPDQATVIVGDLPVPAADAGDDIEGAPGDSISPVNSGEVLAPGRTVGIREWVQLTGLDFYDVAAEDPGFNRNAPVPTISVPNGSLASLTPERSIVFGMRLADDMGLTSDLDLFTVTFTDLPKNSTPTVTASASASIVRPTTSVTLMGVGDDRDGDPLTYRWQQTQGPATVTIQQSNDPVASFSAPATSGRYMFRVTVDDNTGEANATTSAAVTVDVNVAPTLSATVSPPFAPAGAMVNVDATGTVDPDGDTLTYFWQEVAPPGAPVAFTNPTQAATNFMVLPYAGTIAARTRTFQVTVTDAMGPTTMTVTFIPNRPPVPGGLGTTATKIRYDGTATATISGVGAVDPDGDPITFAWRISSGPVNTTGGTLTTAMGPTTGFTVAKPTSSNPDTGGLWTIAGAASDTLETTPEVTINILAFPSWSNDVWPILQNGCATSSCHNSGSNVLFMGTNAGTAYTNMVNQGSAGSSNLRVSPNDYRKSYLWEQVNSGRMPKFGSKLSQDLINIIRDWIEPEGLGAAGTLSTGAENN